jgi:hypothetical protein
MELIAIMGVWLLLRILARLAAAQYHMGMMLLSGRLYQLQRERNCLGTPVWGQANWRDWIRVLES